jgi:hypothetical protein
MGHPDSTLHVLHGDLLEHFYLVPGCDHRDTEPMHVTNYRVALAIYGGVAFSGLVARALGKPLPRSVWRDVLLVAAGFYLALAFFLK